MIATHPAEARSGITLTEILISIMIMGVGMVSLATLFPLGLLRMRDANRMTRSTLLAESAMNDMASRNLLHKQSFLNTIISPFSDVGYTGGVLRSLGPGHARTGRRRTRPPRPHDGPAGASRPLVPGPGLPVAYDPLWRASVPNSNLRGTNPPSYYLNSATRVTEGAVRLGDRVRPSRPRRQSAAERPRPPAADQLQSAGHGAFHNGLSLSEPGSRHAEQHHRASSSRPRTSSSRTRSTG